MKPLNDITLDNVRAWEKPTLVILSISLTKNDPCTGKIGPASPDGNTGCFDEGTATS